MPCKPVIVPPKDMHVPTDLDIQLLLADCSTLAPQDIRDTAIIRVFLDTGVRLSELATMERVGQNIRVLGKGRKTRVLAVSPTTNEWLDHCADLGLFPWDMLAKSIQRMIIRRSTRAGVRMSPHSLRHRFVDQALRKGIAVNDLQTLMGWTSPAMVERYASVHKQERARTAQSVMWE